MARRGPDRLDHRRGGRGSRRVRYHLDPDHHRGWRAHDGDDHSYCAIAYYAYDAHRNHADWNGYDPDWNNHDADWDGYYTYVAWPTVSGG